MDNATSHPVLDVVTAFIKEKDVSRAIAHLAEDVLFDGPLISVRGRGEYRGLLEQFLSAHIETRILQQFSGCHPALEDGESAALALATVVGLSNDETARAFVVAPRSMEQRLTRARKRLREKGDVEGTTPERGLARLPAVLRAIHLLFNEGYWSGEDETPIRADLCRLAIGLARSVVETYPREAEAGGLLALLLLHDARRDARLDESGNPVPLPDQDRTRWNQTAIARATALLDRALAAGAPGPFQIEAAIAAVHSRARSADTTEWDEIALLYALLEGFRPTPGVRVNRAFALGKAKGPAEALELLLRKTGFQVRFRIPLPREVERSEFAPWCAEHLSELLPTHRWLVKHLFIEDDAG